MLRLDMPSIELGLMRAREHVESLEDKRDRESVRKDEDPLVAINYGFLKLDGTEDNDDDDDDETTQNKLLILVLERMLQHVCERKE